jgi:hypothetical protein
MTATIRFFDRFAKNPSRHFCESPSVWLRIKSFWRLPLTLGRTQYMPQIGKRVDKTRKISLCAAVITQFSLWIREK